MATFLELKERVKRRLIDLPAAVLTEVPDLVNKGLRELQRRHNFQVMEALQATTTLVSTRAMVGVVPTDFKELRDRPFTTDDTGYNRELVIAPSRNALIRNWEADDEGAPTALLRSEGGTSWDVWPLPDGNSDYTNGEYRISIPYWKYLPKLVADGDTNWFTTEGEWFIVALATAEGFWLDWDEERATVWEQRGASQLAQIILADKHQRLGGMDTFVPYKDAHAPQLRA